MRVVVTGALGFVGVNLARTLGARGHHVVALDRTEPTSVHERFLAAVADHLTHVQADVADDGFGDALELGAVDGVVHAAAITPLAPGEEVSRAVDTARVNVVGTANVLRWCDRVRPRRVVHVSSATVYGDAGRAPVLTEESPLRPGNVYGITKLAAEQLALRTAALEALDLVVVRLTQPIGAMERTTATRSALSPVHDWCVAAARGEPLPVGDLAPARDYTDVRDVAEAIAALLEHGRLAHRVYNVGGEQRYSLAEILAVLRRLVPDLSTVPGDVNLTPSMVRPPVSSARLRDEVGWEPRIPLEDAVADVLAWARREEKTRPVRTAAGPDADRSRPGVTPR